MALNGILCAAVPLRNYSLTHPTETACNPQFKLKVKNWTELAPNWIRVFFKNWTEVKKNLFRTASRAAASTAAASSWHVRSQKPCVMAERLVWVGYPRPPKVPMLTSPSHHPLSCNGGTFDQLAYAWTVVCQIVWFFTVPKTDARKIDALDQWCLRMLLGIRWYQFVRNDDVRKLTKQPKLTAIIQSRRLTLFGHIMRMDDNADAKRILLASPLADWRRQLGPRITWFSTVQQDLKQHHLTLPEAADSAQKRPLWRMMSTYGATQS